MGNRCYWTLLLRECGLGVDAVLTISQPWTNKKLLESNSNVLSSKKFIKGSLRFKSKKIKLIFLSIILFNEDKVIFDLATILEVYNK